MLLVKITFLGTGAADWPLQKPDDYTEFRRLSYEIQNKEGNRSICKKGINAEIKYVGSHT